MILGAIVAQEDVSPVPLAGLLWAKHGASFAASIV